MMEESLLHEAVQGIRLVKSETEGESEALTIACVVPDPLKAPEVFRACEIENSVREKGLSIFEPDSSLIMVHKNQREADFLFKEIFKNNEYLCNGIELDNNSVVVDIGANVGMVSILIGKLYPGAKIFAIEPMKQLCDAIEFNSAIHGVDVKVLNYAMGAESGSVNYTYYAKNTAMSGVFADKKEDTETLVSYFAAQGQEAQELDLSAMIDEVLEGETMSCEMRTLSSILPLQTIPQIDLLKVDVEKAELDVLNGIDEELWPRIRQIVIEVHDINDRLNVIQSMLRSRGFHTLVDRNQDMVQTNMFTLYASRQSIKPEARELNWSSELGYASKQSIVDAIEKFAGKSVASDYLFRSEFPLNEQGELSRETLLKEFGSEITVTPKAIDEFSPVEAKMAEIWKRILKREEVAKSDDFFALGGSSLLAVRLIVEIEKEFGEGTFPPDQLFSVSIFKDVVNIVEEAIQ